MRRARYFLRWPCLRQLSSAVLLSGLVCLQPLAQPAADSASTVSRIEQPSAEDWLQKMARSSRQLNYRGTLVYSRGRQMESLQFSHVLDREGVQHEHLRSLSGRPREIVRRGDMVFRLRADGRLYACRAITRQHRLVATTSSAWSSACERRHRTTTPISPATHELRVAP